MTPASATVDHDVLRARVRRTLARLSITGELPTLPPAATAALALARDPNSDMEDLSRLIRTDVSLAARVLRVANSAGYGRRAHARTLTEAIGTIGLRKTCDLLVVACTRDLFRGPDPAVRVLWDHALVTAIATEELARVTREVDAATAFLPGLFHDVGRLSFLVADPVAGHLIRDLAAAGEGETRELESEWFGFAHSDASAILAGDWGLDAAQADGIRWHHEPARAGVGKPLAVLLCAADRMARNLGYGTDARLTEVVLGEPEPVLAGLAPDAEARCAERVRAAYIEQSALFG
jgi:HD-like signal output (HDOD) protein